MTYIIEIDGEEFDISTGYDHQAASLETRQALRERLEMSPIDWDNHEDSATLAAMIQDENFAAAMRLIDRAEGFETEH